MRQGISTAALSAAAVVVLGAWAGAHALVIDTFAEGSLAFVPASSTVHSQVAGGMLGGERDESVTNASASGGIIAGASGDAYGYGAIGATGSALLSWDGGDASPAVDFVGLLGADFTEGGTHDALSIELLSNDLTAPLVLTVYTSASDFSQVTVMTPGGFPSGPSQILEIPFASFSPAGAGADFANVGAFTLEIDGAAQPQLDLTLGSIVTSALAVPEPGTLALTTLGLCLLAARSRRRRRRRWRPPSLPSSL